MFSIMKLKIITNWTQGLKLIIFCISLLCLICCKQKEIPLELEELKFQRQYGLEIIYNELIKNPDVDSSFVKNQIKQLINDENGKIKSLVFETKKLESFNSIELNENTIFNDAITISKNNNSFLNSFFPSLVLDVILGDLIFIVFVFLITLPFDYNNFSILRVTLVKMHIITVLSLISSFFISPGEIIGITKGIDTEILKAVERRTSEIDEILKLL